MLLSGTILRNSSGSGQGYSFAWGGSYNIVVTLQHCIFFQYDHCNASYSFVVQYMKVSKPQSVNIVIFRATIYHV